MADVPVNIQVKYLTMTRKIIKSEGDRKLWNITQTIHMFLLAKRLTVFHIRLANYLKACVSPRDVQEGDILHDGPSHWSPQVPLHTQALCLSTFQFVFQVLRPNTKHPHIRSVLSYWGQHVPGKPILLESNDSKHVELPGGTCEEQISTLCIVRFQTGQNRHINISLTNLNFNGLQATNCLFGGVSFFGDLQLLLDICTTHRNLSRPARNIYVSQPNLTIVLFSYKGYSLVNMTASATAMDCTPVRLDSCKLDAFCGGNKNGTDLCQQILKQISPDSILAIQDGSISEITVLLITLSADRCAVLHHAHEFEHFSDMSKQTCHIELEFLIPFDLRQGLSFQAMGFSEWFGSVMPRPKNKADIVFSWFWNPESISHFHCHSNCNFSISHDQVSSHIGVLGQTQDFFFDSVTKIKLCLNIRHHRSGTIFQK